MIKTRLNTISPSLTPICPRCLSVWSSSSSFPPHSLFLSLFFFLSFPRPSFSLIYSFSLSSFPLLFLSFLFFFISLFSLSHTHNNSSLLFHIQHYNPQQPIPYKSQLFENNTLGSVFYKNNEFIDLSIHHQSLRNHKKNSHSSHNNSSLPRPRWRGHRKR